MRKIVNTSLILSLSTLITLIAHPTVHAESTPLTTPYLMVAEQSDETAESTGDAMATEEEKGALDKIKETAKDVYEGAKKAIGIESEAEGEAESLKEAGQELTEEAPTPETVGESAENMAEEAEQAAETAAEETSEAADAAAETVEETAEATADTAEEAAEETAETVEEATGE